MENEFILTILSSLAEEESHSISENEKWTIQKRMQAGTFRPSKAPYGFHWNGEILTPDVRKILRNLNTTHKIVSQIAEINVQLTVM